MGRNQIKKCAAASPAADALARTREAVAECLSKPLQDPLRVILVQVQSPAQARSLASELPRTLRLTIVEDADHLTRADLTRYRRWINRSRVVVVIFITPQTWQRWNRYWPVDTQPLRRRIHAIIELPNSETI